MIERVYDDTSTYDGESNEFFMQSIHVYWEVA